MTLTDEEAGKLFVGGLSWETSQEKLSEYFSRYGHVVDSVVMKNNYTGRSRGFGFVTFRDPDVLSLVLADRPHKLDGKTIDPKSCTPRSQRKGKEETVQKLFLGGLPPTVTETEIRQAFSEFGKVHEVNIMYDQEKKKSRGFGFLSFESSESAQQACAQHFVDLGGKQVECKFAVPRDGSRGDRFQSQQSYHSNAQWGGPRMLPPQQNWMHGSHMAASSAPAYTGWGAAQPSSQQYPAYSTDGDYNNAYQGYTATPASYPAAAAYTSTGASQYGQAAAYSNYSSSSQQTTPALSGSYDSSAASGNAGLGTYTQESSQYGPTKTYATGNPASYESGYSNGQNQEYQGGAGSLGEEYDSTSSQPARGGYGHQNYHPYRR